MPIDKDRWRAVSPLLDRALELSVESARMARGAAGTGSRARGGDRRVARGRTCPRRARAFSSTGPRHAAPATLAGQLVGAYTLEAPLGQGGMGSVWLARRSDGRFEGKVAVKFLNAALIGQAGEQRFRREGNILARLTHPHIARLIDAGVAAAGQPYLVLDYVEGERIDHYCDGQRPRRRRRVCDCFSMCSPRSRMRMPT